jgi:hypothetical protein
LSFSSKNTLYFAANGANFLADFFSLSPSRFFLDRVNSTALKY